MDSSSKITLVSKFLILAYQEDKNIVLFSALHHSRECLTLTMIVKILAEYTRGLVTSDPKITKFFENNRIL